MLRPADVAAQYNLAIGTLAYWRSAGTGPPYFRLAPRLIRYRRSALEEWIAGREVRPGTERPTQAASPSYAATLAG
jgi:predicted DNA-binding transcriptional regulator AlpA